MSTKSLRDGTDKPISTSVATASADSKGCAHTPGPWNWDQYFFQLDAADAKLPILEIGIGYDGNWGGEPPSAANARLIAAAPDLLAAVIHLGAEGHRFGSVAGVACPECIAARAAIKKAEQG